MRKLVYKMTARVGALLMMILSLFLYSACGSDELPEPDPVVEEGKAGLQISIAKDNITRASGSAIPLDEGTIKRVTMGVFFQDGTVNLISEPEYADGKATVNCSPGECDVVVVVNAPSGLFGGVTTKSAFLEKLVSLSDFAANNVQQSNNLPMSGETSVKLTVGVLSKPTVTVSRLVARISINSLKTAFDPNGQFKNAQFKLNKVFAYNVIANSKVAVGGWSATMPSNPVWLNGGTVNDGNFVRRTAYLLDEISPAVTIPGTGYSAKHWFYVFPNNDIDTPTKIVLSGLFDPDGAGPLPEVTTYFPIVMNKAQAGTSITGGGQDGGTGTIMRNSEYKLSVTLKSKGVSSPDEILIPTTIDLIVDIADWEMSVSQEIVVE